MPGKGKTMRQIPKGRKTTKKVKITQMVKVRPMKPTAKATISTLVKNILNQKSETKMVSNTLLNRNYNSLIDNSDVFPLMPIVPNGSESYMRLGDSIKPVSLTVRGTLALNRNFAVDNRVIIARVMVLQCKGVKTNQGLVAIADKLSSLLRPNDTTSGVATPTLPFGGVLSHIDYPVNTDYFRVYHDKRYELSGSSGVGQGSGQEQQPNSSRKFKFDVQVPATIDFGDDDISGDQATNFAPFMVIGYAYADGKGPDLEPTDPTRLIATSVSTLRFKDF